MRRIIPFSLGAIALSLAACLTGCEDIADNVATFDGPRTISAEAQTVVYVPTEDTTPTVTQVHYWLIQDGTEDLYGSDAQYAADGGTLFEFDFFTVSVVGQNIVLDIDENTSDCYREVTVSFRCDGYDPDELIVTQLPPSRDSSD